MIRTNTLSLSALSGMSKNNFLFLSPYYLITIGLYKESSSAVIAFTNASV